jgi:hypothetical protein
LAIEQALYNRTMPRSNRNLKGRNRQPPSHPTARHRADLFDARKALGGAGRKPAPGHQPRAALRVGLRAVLHRRDEGRGRRQEDQPAGPTWSIKSDVSSGPLAGKPGAFGIAAVVWR